MNKTLLAGLRRAVPTIVLLAGASALLLATDRQSASRDLPAVAVLQHTSSLVIEEAVQGMIAGLAAGGWTDGKTVTIRRFNAEGDIAQANAIAREIVGGPFDMVLTSSTPSLQAVATANARGRLKHVFAAVADPFSAGVGLDRSDPLVHPPHLVGYGSLAPVHATFRLARRINPRLARIGAAHNPAESNSRRFMELARASCKQLGIELYEAPVENSSGVREAVQSTLARGAEAIFVPGDTTVMSALDSVIATAAKAGVPAFSVNPGVPDRGTLFDVGYNYREIGLVAGKLAGEILAGTDPRTVPIRETAGIIAPALTVNLAAAGVDRDRWRVPEDVVAQARFLVDATGPQTQSRAVLAGPFDEAAP